jgi:translation elongation factor EF-1alpha
MGTIIFGKLESGKIHKGQSLLLMPNKVQCSLHSEDYWCNLHVRLARMQGEVMGTSCLLC